MHRFFSTHSDLTARQITIIDISEIHHMRDVLRLKNGDSVAIFDGSGKEAVGTIAAIKEAAITITVNSLRDNKPSRNIRMILACAIPKKTKFEFIIEKCTELGVDEIIPMRTQRTEFISEESRINKKEERYKAVAINAAKQSKRSVVPVIRPVTKFENVLTNLSPDTVGFIPHLGSDTKNLIQALKNKPATRNVIFFIGPEGDFTPDEVKKAREAGCIPVSLGPTVLKVDTAYICVVSLANLLLGN